MDFSNAKTTQGQLVLTCAVLQVGALRLKPGSLLLPEAIIWRWHPVWVTSGFISKKKPSPIVLIRQHGAGAAAAAGWFDAFGGHSPGVGKGERAWKQFRRSNGPAQGVQVYVKPEIRS